MLNFSFLILGIYLLQEYGNKITNIKIYINKYYDEFQKTELYKNLVKKK